MTRGSASGGSTSRGICIQEKSASGDLPLGGLYPWGSASSGVCLQGGWADLPPEMGYYGIQSTRRWYASYWNAFLLSMKTSNVSS